MSATRKSADLLPKIIDCSTSEEAISILVQAMEMLHLTSDYTTLVKLKDELDEFKIELSVIRDTYESFEVPRQYVDIHEVRVGLNFLYMRASDALSFEVNKLKIFHGDDRRSEIKANSAEAVRKRLEKEAVESGAKKPSHSLIMDIYASEPSYKEFVAMKSVSYALYKELTDLLTGIIKFSDSISSEEGFIKNLVNRN